MNHKGMDDCRPESSHPKPGKIDRTSSGSRSPKDVGNVGPFMDRESTSKGWKGLPDSRPNSK